MDRYEKVRRIGEGAFGKAVLVKGKQNGRQYVVKEIRIAKVTMLSQQSMNMVRGVLICR